MTPGGDGDPHARGSASVLDEPSLVPDGSRRGRSRRRAAIGVALLVATGLTVGGVAALQDREPERVVQTPDRTTSPPIAWRSGASGEGVASGEFGEWRGRPVDIAATWVDNNEAMLEFLPLQPGEEYGGWEPALDIAVGAFDGEESWADAADGEYEDRWEESLSNLRELRADLPGAVYIRFAHEMNGNWYPWSVTEDSADDFVTAWRRFRALQQEIYPEAQLVFCVNQESVGTGIDWREFFPGEEYVDVMAVDYYNQNPFVGSVEDWNDGLDATDDFGSPKGLQQHLDFARSVGLPLAVPEWSGVAEEGDSPAFIEGMYDFFDAHGGDGAGEILYEIQFNVVLDDHPFSLFDEYTRMPESAETYQRLW
jgi:Glycosyl hydrolase family 26